MRSWTRVLTLVVIISFASQLFMTNLVQKGEEPGTFKFKPKTLYPPPWRLGNIITQYLINNDICSSLTPRDSGQNEEDGQVKLNKVKVFNLVTSHAGNIQHRQELREQFPAGTLKEMGIRRVFLIGNPDSIQNKSCHPRHCAYNTNVTLKELGRENVKHSDLIVGDFTEAYKNLSYKHLMGLDWVTRYCPQAEFILKQDDDTTVDYEGLISLLSEPAASSPSYIFKNVSSSGFFWGSLQKKDEVPRDEGSPWFVSKEEFPHQFYPPYVRKV